MAVLATLSQPAISTMLLTEDKEKYCVREESGGENKTEATFESLLVCTRISVQMLSHFRYAANDRNVHSLVMPDIEMLSLIGVSVVSIAVIYLRGES